LTTFVTAFVTSFAKFLIFEFWVWVTFWQLFDNFFDNFLTTFWQLFDYFLTAFWQFFDNFATTFWQRFHNFGTTFLTTFVTTFVTSFAKFLIFEFWVWVFVRSFGLGLFFVVTTPFDFPSLRGWGLTSGGLTSGSPSGWWLLATLGSFLTTRVTTFWTFLGNVFTTFLQLWDNLLAVFKRLFKSVHGKFWGVCCQAIHFWPGHTYFMWSYSRPEEMNVLGIWINYRMPDRIRSGDLWQLWAAFWQPAWQRFELFWASFWQRFDNFLTTY
jgi:hypothetical protein